MESQRGQKAQGVTAGAQSHGKWQITTLMSAIYHLFPVFSLPFSCFQPFFPLSPVNDMTTLSPTTTNQQWTRMIKVKKQVTWDNWIRVCVQRAKQLPRKIREPDGEKEREVVSDLTVSLCITSSLHRSTCKTLCNCVTIGSDQKSHWITTSLSDLHLSHCIIASVRPAKVSLYHCPTCKRLSVSPHHFQTSLCHCLANTANISL